MEHNCVGNRRSSADSLVIRAQQGDRSSFDALTKPLRTGLLAVAFVRTGDYQEAEDLTQESLSRAWSHLSELRDASAFVPWLRSILARLCATWHRRSFDSSISLHDEMLQNIPDKYEMQPPDVLMRRVRAEEIRSALCLVPEANRIALLMAVWGNCSYQEIAAFSGVSVSTIEGRIYRAKSLLRRKLGTKSSDFLGEPVKRWRENSYEEELK
jgi:RNA polymerase sigma-70 factor (ECF subfamily)